MNTVSIDLQLAKSKKLYAVGDRKIEERPIAKKLKNLAKTGILSVLLLAQLLNLAPNTKIDTTNNVGQATIEQVSDFQSKFESDNFINPFNDIELASKYIDSNGIINGKALIKDWKASGVDSQNLIKLSQILIITQSPTLVADKDAFDRVMGVSERSVGLFELNSNEEANEYIENYSLDIFAEYGLIAPFFAKVQNIQATDESVVNDALTMIWDNYTESSVSNTVVLENISMHEAMENLQYAFNQTGLKSLRVPLPLWDNPDNINALATNLMLANEELSRVTGFTGEVLGLNKSVNLTLGIPHKTSFTQTFENEIYIQSSIDALGHEWSHGLTSKIELSGNKEALDIVNKTIERLENKSETIPDSFYKEIDNISEHSEHYVWKDYFQRVDERFAYQMAAYMSYKLTDSLIASNEINIEHTHNSLLPSIEEASHMSSIWEEAFKELNEGYWSVSGIANVANAFEQSSEQLLDNIASQNEGFIGENIENNQLSEVVLETKASNVSNDSLFEKSNESLLETLAETYLYVDMNTNDEFAKVEAKIYESALEDNLVINNRFNNDINSVVDSNGNNGNSFSITPKTSQPLMNLKRIKSQRVIGSIDSDLVNNSSNNNDGDIYHSNDANLTTKSGKPKIK